jgi:bla regulator protein blaR1
MIEFQDFARFAAGQAVNCLLIGIAVAALASLLLRFRPRESSASRFAVLYSSLLAIVALLFWRGATGGADAVQAHAVINVSGKWATYLVAAWAAVALFGIARIARGLARLQRLRRSFVPLDHKFEADFRGTRPATIYVSSQVRVPMAIGFFRPAVVLPKWALTELSAEELRAAILHELAHIDRWDDWTNLLQKIIRAVLFFHPAVWWIDNRLATEREMSCDDRVLVQSPNPRSYAECLVSLAEKSLLRRPLALAQAAVGKVKQTTLRVGRILNGRVRKKGKAWKPALAAFGALSTLSFVAVEHTPRLVGFNDPSSSSSLAAQYRPSYQPPATLASMRGAPVSQSSGSGQQPAVREHRVKTTKPQPHVPEYPATSVEARATRPHDPAVINASATESQTPQFVYFVFQTREYDGMGEMRVTTTVWRVQVPAQAQADNGTLPHST